MNRMETMREAVARALYDRVASPEGSPPWDQLDPGTKGLVEGDADAALAALGLDDLDAAVERAGEALSSFRTTATPDAIEGPWSRRMAAVVLEAALTATPESEVSDG